MDIPDDIKKKEDELRKDGYDIDGTSAEIKRIITEYAQGIRDGIENRNITFSEIEKRMKNVLDDMEDLARKETDKIIALHKKSLEAKNKKAESQESPKEIDQ